MTIVSEVDIENLIDKYDADDNLFVKHQAHMVDSQLAISALLTDDGLQLLTEDEQDVLWFITTVVHASYTGKNTVKEINLQILEGIEEENWEKLNAAIGATFRDRVTSFFDGFEQEDLLAFIEDALESDEDVNISASAREVLFVTSKTMLDGMIKYTF